MDPIKKRLANRLGSLHSHNMQSLGCIRCGSVNKVLPRTQDAEGELAFHVGINVSRSDMPYVRGLFKVEKGNFLGGLIAVYYMPKVLEETLIAFDDVPQTEAQVAYPGDCRYLSELVVVLRQLLN
jgi:hypothetical protein